MPKRKRHVSIRMKNLGEHCQKTEIRPVKRRRREAVDGRREDIICFQALPIPHDSEQRPPSPIPDPTSLPHRYTKSAKLFGILCKSCAPSSGKASQEVRSRFLIRTTSFFASVFGYVPRRTLPMRTRCQRQLRRTCANGPGTSSRTAKTFPITIGLGKYVCAMDVVRFVASSEIQEKYSLAGTISLPTAKRWRQKKFLPRMEELSKRMQWYTKDGDPEVDIPALGTAQRRVIVWFHDESTFYANDRRQVYWVHKDEKATPRTKGEGASLMVADFISADFGWLCSPTTMSSNS